MSWDTRNFDLSSYSVAYRKKPESSKSIWARNFMESFIFVMLVVLFLFFLTMPLFEHVLALPKAHPSLYFAVAIVPSAVLMSVLFRRSSWWLSSIKYLFSGWLSFGVVYLVFSIVLAISKSIWNSTTGFIESLLLLFVLFVYWAIMFHVLLGVILVSLLVVQTVFGSLFDTAEDRL